MNFTDRNTSVFGYFLKGAHCKFPFFQQVKKYAENKVAGCSGIFNGILVALKPRGGATYQEKTCSGTWGKFL